MNKALVEDALADWARDHHAVTVIETQFREAKADLLESSKVVGDLIIPIGGMNGTRYFLWLDSGKRMGFGDVTILVSVIKNKDYDTKVITYNISATREDNI